MRFLHTSDLHLGRSLNGVDLSAAQQRALDQMVQVAVSRHVDAVLVAGDVYDRAFPPAHALVMFENFLVQLHEAGIAVVVVSGNHDQPERLGYGSALFRHGLHLLTDPREVDQPVRLRDEHGDVLVFGIPFLEPEVARRLLVSDDGELLEPRAEAVIAEAMRRVRSHIDSVGGSPRVVVVSHAFVLGGEGSDSERDVTVGGVDYVPSAAYAGAHYVALGHLHGPQQPAPVGVDGVLRYSGSPLRYSISECAHVKSVTVVELDAHGATTIDVVEIEQERPMADLTGTLDELLSEQYAAHRDSWVRLTATDDQRPDSLVPRLRAAFPHMIDYRHLPASAQSQQRIMHVDSASDPLDVVAAFVAEVRPGQPLTGDERDLLVEAIAEVRRAELA